MKKLDISQEVTDARREFGKAADLICSGLATLAVVILFALSQVAHADAGHDDAKKIGEPGKADAVTRTVEIVMLDIYFEPETISVQRGETVRFVVRNDGQLVHEFNIGTASMHTLHQEEMLIMAGQGMLLPDRIVEHTAEMSGDHLMKHDDPNSVLLEPGKSGEIIWKFTTDAALEFACNVPGHYPAGMVGEFQWQ